MKSRPVGSHPLHFFQTDAVRHSGDIQESEPLEPAHQVESALEHQLQTVVLLEQAWEERAGPYRNEPLGTTPHGRERAQDLTALVLQLVEAPYGRVNRRQRRRRQREQ